MLRIFISAGEPSGDMHGSNLLHALQHLHPAIECNGFGGERLENAGCRLLYPLCQQLAVMGFRRVFSNIHTFVRLLRQADTYFIEKRPDAVILIDYPGFHWWLARSARARGIPVFYFVPPQIWAWASWRIHKMRRSVNHVLCSLPFEESWYQMHGVPARYLGHPYFDELARQPLNAAFVEEEQDRGSTIIGLLPGSRDQELEWNLETLLRAADRIHAARPETRFLVACFRPEQRLYVERHFQGRNLPITAHAGRTPEIIHLAHSCIAVSGSVGLELLYRNKPAVVVYRAGRLPLLGARLLKNVPYISLVNLLASKELFPEFLGPRYQDEAAAGHVLRWLNDARAYHELCQELAGLRSRVAEPGACRRTARYILEALGQMAQQPKAA